MVTSVQVRDLLKQHGTCRLQDSSQWTGDIPLPAGIADFYRDVGPVNITINGFGNPTIMPSLSKLWDQQVGYRWHGVTLEPILDWNNDWIVVAYEGGNPYIYSHGRILFDLCGASVWEPIEAFEDLNSMAACLSILGSIALSAGDDFTDKGGVIRARFRDEAVSRITEIQGSRSDAEAVLVTAGWECPILP